MNNKFNRYSGFLTWFMALLLSALAVGCGGGGDPFLGGGGAAGTAATVTATFPIANATSVPTNTKIITATFTKAMDPATLTTASFTLTCPAGTPQTGAVSYVMNGSVATLTLAVTNTLPANTICTATVTTAAKDTAGIPLANNFSWTFTSGLAVDTTAPTVTGTVNPNGATNVAINTKVGATFSEAMDPLTISANTFTLKQGTTAVAGTVTYAGVNAVLTPTSNLAPNTTYTITVTTGAMDVRGNPLASDFVWSWTTGAAPDTTPPVVTGTLNANGAINVPVNTKIATTFSEAIDPLLITNLNLTMKETASGNAVVGTVSYSGVTALFIPLNNLAYSTGYTMTAKGGTSGVKDLAGNAMVNDFVWSWTTGVALDTTPPLVTGTINVNGAINVAVNTKVGATFSEGMDPLTITNNNFSLKETFSGAGVAGVISYTGVHSVFIPTNNLANNTGYTVTVKGGINGVKDLAGNPMTNDFVISWSTGAALDTTPPTVVATVPLANATNMPYNAKQTVTFSEGMDPLSLTTLTYTIFNGANQIPGVVTYTGLIAVFESLVNFADNANYTSTITTGAKDLAGNAMANNYVWNWSTGAARDVTPPTVISTLHADGATDVPITAHVGATFSEAMNPLTVTTATFSLKPTGSTTAVPGTLSYTGVSLLFIPLRSLAENTNYTATITQRAEDLAGNLMASDYAWRWTTFGNVAPTTAATTTTTAAATTTTTAGATTTTVFGATTTTTTTTTTLRANAGPTAVNLATAGNYAILAESLISTTGTTAITGDIAVSPAAATFIQGFSLVLDSTGCFSTPVPSTLVTGKIYAADYNTGSCTTPAILTTAINDMAHTATSGYQDAAGRPGGTGVSFLNVGGGNLGGKSLPAGTYTFSGASINVTIPSDLTLTGNANDVWIFQIPGNLDISSAKQVLLDPGVKAKNIFWQVAGAVTLNTTSHFEGIILTATQIAMRTGATINGRLLAQTQVTLDANTVTQPAP